MGGGDLTQVLVLIWQALNPLGHLHTPLYINLLRSLLLPPDCGSLVQAHTSSLRGGWRWEGSDPHFLPGCFSFFSNLHNVLLGVGGRESGHPFVLRWQLSLLIMPCDFT